MAFGLAGDDIGGAKLGLGDLGDLAVEAGIVDEVELARLLGGALGEPDDRVDHRLEALVAEHHGAEHVVLGQLARLGFDHQHRVGGAGDDQVELRFGQLVDLRVEDEGAVDQADAGAADRAHEGHARDGQRGGGRDHGDDVGIVLEVVGEDGGDDLGLVAEALDEERADRAVDQPRDERLVLARPAFALEVAAGDLARGEGLFLVVDGEREEVDAGLRLPRGDHGRQHRRLAIGGEHGAVGLAGEFSGFELELTSSPVDLDTLDVEHGSSFHDASGTRGRAMGKTARSFPLREKASGDPAMAPVSASIRNAAAPCRRAVPQKAFDGKGRPAPRQRLSPEAQAIDERAVALASIFSR